MNTLEQTIRIQVSPQRVFDAMCDLANATSRIRAITRLEVLTEGPMRRGTRFRETRIMFGREATETMEVTRFDPPRGYDLRASSCGCEYRSAVRVAAAPGGATDLSMTFQSTPLTVMARIMGTLLRPLMRKAVCSAFRRDLEDIKASLEGEAAQQIGRQARPQPE